MQRWWVLACALVIAGCGGTEESGQGAAVANVGETTYQRYCFSCHASGAAGAPRVGDAEAWALRTEKGEDVLLASTIEGMPPGMPPRGMCLQCSDEDLAAAIDYMLDRSKAN